jgi:hypothetical protein
LGAFTSVAWRRIITERSVMVEWTRIQLWRVGIQRRSNVEKIGGGGYGYGGGTPLKKIACRQ